MTHVRWPTGAKHNSISLVKHNNLFENTTIFLRTQQSFTEQNNISQSKTIFHRTQQSFPEHNNLFFNTTRFSDTQQTTRTQQKFVENNNFKVLVTSPYSESYWNLALVDHKSFIHTWKARPCRMITNFAIS